MFVVRDRNNESETFLWVNLLVNFPNYVCVACILKWMAWYWSLVQVLSGESVKNHTKRKCPKFRARHGPCSPCMGHLYPFLVLCMSLCWDKYRLCRLIRPIRVPLWFLYGRGMISLTRAFSPDMSSPYWDPCFTYFFYSPNPNWLLDICSFIQIKVRKRRLRKLTENT